MNDIWEFWNILNTNLQHKYHTAPVHTYEELKLLMTRFPENIKGYVVKDAENHNVLAGSLIYITPQVTHTQYIAASPQGKEEGALDLLFDELINQKQWNTTYFDFGNQPSSKVLISMRISSTRKKDLEEEASFMILTNGNCRNSSNT